MTAADLRQDEDALDTWFSSWLWPISVFNGILEPDNKEIEYYYPTNDLVTAPEILFFWVARMIIAGYEYRDAKPFSNVYLTGIVRDKQRRKMSKQLGNSPDPILLMDKYGADGVRVGMLLSSPAGNDLMFDVELCEQGSKFVNKIWNAYRLIQGWEVSEAKKQTEAEALALKWYRNRFQQVLRKVESEFKQYRISTALMETYRLVWDDFCSTMLEAIKPPYGEAASAQTYREAIAIFEDNLRILHPFTPFLTEELWQDIAERSPNEALIVSSWPKHEEFDADFIANFDFAMEVVSGIRTIRKNNQIAFKETVDLVIADNEQQGRVMEPIIQKLGNVANISHGEAVDGALTFRVKANEYFVPISGAVDVEAQIAKISEELSYTEGFLKSVQKKLSNERFVNNAPEQVVAVERKKEADALAKIETLKASLAALQ